MKTEERKIEQLSWKSCKASIDRMPYACKISLSLSIIYIQYISVYIINIIIYYVINMIYIYIYIIYM